MRKKLAGIHLLAPLSETDIVNYSRNLDRELIVNTTIVTDAIVDSVEKTNYIVTFEYDSTLDGGTNQIRRSIPTLELLSYTGENMSGAHWVNVENMEYHYITPGTSSQQAFEELDEELSKLSRLKHIQDADGNGAIVSSADGEAPSSTVDSSVYAIVLGSGHILSTSPNSGIIGGTDSTINGTMNTTYLFIVGGKGNNISGIDDGQYHDNLILSGSYNYISDSSNSTIINGSDHHIQTHSHESVIIGGHHNILREWSFNSSFISTDNSIIESSMFASMESTASSSIINSDFSASIASSYILIQDGSYNKITNSHYGTILDAVSSTIDGNTITGSARLVIYNTNTSMLSHSRDSYIWNATLSSIISSDACHIYETISTVSTSKTATYIVVDSIIGFTIGQLVTLFGAEFNDYGNKTYIITSIDIDNKRLSFINTDGTSLTFNTGNSAVITVRSLTNSTNEAIILSNTSDTLVLSTTIPTYTSKNAYAFITDGINRYTPIVASGTETFTNTIKLKLFGSDTIITTFTAKQFNGKKIIVYYDRNSNTSYSNICASSISYITGGYHSLLFGSYNSYIKPSGFTSIITSSESYIDGVSYGSIISSTKSSISSGCSLSGIICGDNHKIINGHNSVILGGVYNTIDGFSSVVLAGCNNVTVTRNAALYAQSLTLVDNTIELTNKIPTAGDVLVVDSVIDGKIAAVTWRKGGSSFGDLMSSSVYTLYGSSKMYWGGGTAGTGYIGINLDDPTPAANNGISVGLTTTGYQYNDTWKDPYYMYNGGDADSVVKSEDGIHIDIGYKYLITFDSFTTEWIGNTSVNAPNVTISNTRQVTIYSSSNPLTNYVIEYSVDGGEKQPFANTNNNFIGNVDIGGLSGTNIQASQSQVPRFNMVYNRDGDTGWLKFILGNIQESQGYASPVDMKYFYDTDGYLYAYWPEGYDLPTHITNPQLYLACRDVQYWSGTQLITLSGWVQHAVTSITNTNTRLVKLSYGGDPNPQLLTMKVWCANFGPKLSVSVNISVLKVSDKMISFLS